MNSFKWQTKNKRLGFQIMKEGHLQCLKHFQDSQDSKDFNKHIFNQHQLMKQSDLIIDPSAVLSVLIINRQLIKIKVWESNSVRSQSCHMYHHLGLKNKEENLDMIVNM